MVFSPYFVNIIKITRPAGKPHFERGLCLHKVADFYTFYKFVYKKTAYLVYYITKLIKMQAFLIKFQHIPLNFNKFIHFAKFFGDFLRRKKLSAYYNY